MKKLVMSSKTIFYKEWLKTKRRLEIETMILLMYTEGSWVK